MKPDELKRLREVAEKALHLYPYESKYKTDIEFNVTFGRTTAIVLLDRIEKLERVVEEYEATLKYYGRPGPRDFPSQGDMARDSLRVGKELMGGKNE